VREGIGGELFVQAIEEIVEHGTDWIVGYGMMNVVCLLRSYFITYGEGSP
jgi:hypothetical protein